MISRPGDRDPRRPKQQNGSAPSNSSNSKPSPSYPPPRSNSVQSPARPNLPPPSSTTTSIPSKSHQLNPSSRESSARRDSVDSSTSDSHKKRAAVDQNDSNRPTKIGFRSTGGSGALVPSGSGAGSGSMSGRGGPRDKSNTPDSRPMDIDKEKGKEKEKSEGQERRTRDAEKETDGQKEIKRALEQFIDNIYLQGRTKAEEYEKIKRKIEMHKAQLNSNPNYDDEQTLKRIAELETREVKVKKEYESMRKKTRAPLLWVLDNLDKMQETPGPSNDSSSDERLEQIELSLEALKQLIERLNQTQTQIGSRNDSSKVSVGGEGEEDEELSSRAIEELKEAWDDFREEQNAQLEEKFEELPELIREVIEQVREEVKLRRNGGEASNVNSPVPSANPKADSRNPSAQPSQSRNSSIQPQPLRDSSHDPSSSTISSAHIAAQSQDSKRLEQMISELSNKYEKMSERCSSIEGDNAQLRIKVEQLESEIKHSKRRSEERLKKLETELIALTGETNKRIQGLQDQIKDESLVGNNRNLEILKNNKEFPNDLENLKRDYENCLKKFNELNKDDEFLDLRSRQVEENARIMSLTHQVAELKSKWESLMRILSKQGEESEEIEIQQRPMEQNKQQKNGKGPPNNNQAPSSRQSQDQAATQQKFQKGVEVRKTSSNDAPSSGAHSKTRESIDVPTSVSSSLGKIENPPATNLNSNLNGNVNGIGNGNGSGNVNANRVANGGRAVIMPPERYLETAQMLVQRLSGSGVKVTQDHCLQALKDCGGDLEKTMNRILQQRSSSASSPQASLPNPQQSQQAQRPQSHRLPSQPYQHPSQSQQQQQKQWSNQGSNRQFP